MEEAGIIVPSKSSWSSPIVLVKKPDNSIRFCVDYRQLNRVTETDAYPMPRLEDLVERMGGAEFLSSLDLTRGYWQVPVRPEDRDKTAFIAHVGLWEFTRMPFGLKNAPATFQRTMNWILRDLTDFTVVYLDDVGVFSRSWGEHLEHLERVLTRIQQAGLTIKAAKCHLGKREVKYLGYVVGGGSIRTERSKVEAIETWPIPTTKKKVRSFLGFVGYYRRFIPNFSEIASPLTDLTKKRNQDSVVWTRQCEQAFQKLKDSVLCDPVLIAPNFGKEFLLYTDASGHGVGAVLSQEGMDGEVHPVLYLSRKLNDREQHLSTVEKECLGIIWAVTKLRPYLWGRKFTLMTDHSPLCWLHNMKGTNGKLLRWSLMLQDYIFDIKHIKGKDNVIADFLSRGGHDVSHSKQ